MNNKLHVKKVCQSAALEDPKPLSGWLLLKLKHWVVTSLRERTQRRERRGGLLFPHQQHYIPVENTRVELLFLDPFLCSHRQPLSPSPPVAMVVGAGWERGLVPSSCRFFSVIFFHA
jgi:hypothetical protein